jgi:DNA primase
MNEQISFSEITKQVYDVYGDQSVLPIIFGVASIYRDHIVSVTGSFPVLYLKGGFATGKTSLAVAIQAIFSQSKSMLCESVTSKYFYKTMTPKGIAIFDNYSCDFRYDGAIKASYDDVNIYSGRSTNKGANMKLDSSLIITSTDLLTSQIVLSRTILASNENSDYSKFQRQSFQQLHDNLNRNNCNCVEELVSKTKSSPIMKFAFLYYRSKSDFLFLSEIENRRIKDNYATLIAVFECLEDILKFPFCKAELIDVLAKSIMEHDLLLNPSKYSAR